VLVVHVQPYDDPYGLKDEVQFIRVSGKPNVVQLANKGVEAASGEIVHVLGCRMNVLEGWTDAALAHFEESDVAAVSPLVVDAVHGQVAAAGVNYGLAGSRKIVGPGIESKNTRRISKLQTAGPTLDAGFYRRETLLALGGWEEVLGDVADVDLAQTLAALGQRTVLATDCVIHERTPAPRLGGFSHGRAMERLFWRQTSVRNRGLAIMLHTLSVLSDFVLRIPQKDAVATLLGRLIGMLNSGTKTKYPELLADVRALLESEAPSTLSLESAREQRSESTPRRKAA
jgi:hypothetical protein